MSDLTFAAFRAANLARCLKWHPQGIGSWSPPDWLTAVTGELGELASLLKMRNRERDGLPGNKFSPTDKQIADELADVLTYLDLLAAALDVDLGRATVEKFNEVSARVGFPDRIPAPHRKDPMNADTRTTTPAIGTPLEGGHYAGRIRLPDGEYAILVAPKAVGEHAPIAWSSAKRLDGALSFFDGFANNLAMQRAGSPLAEWTLKLVINDFADWYLPSRDELELCYRNLKPGTGKNWCYRGDNPSSVPVGSSYMPDSPEQTAIEAFRAGGPEAFDEDWYWTSTQYAGDASSAWCQGFSNGVQYNGLKVNKLRVRAVRRFKL
jgi:NTP pyrophosphatase (non-canonical NTP hydrolase)